MKLCAYTIVATILLLTPVFLVRAQTPCGNVVIPTDFYGEGFEAQITPIQNCDNPLNADANVSFTTSFTLRGEAVTESKIFEVAAGSTTIDLTFEMSPRSFSSPLDIYRREGQDYILTYVSNNNKPDPTPVSLLPGKYTAAFVYTEPPIINQATPTFLEKVFAFLLPTAHAYYLSFQEIKIVNFEIVEIVPEPTGASSVLFLPGIQASRLYTDGFLGTENQLWEPNINGDVEKLELTSSGDSVNDVYTKEVVDSITGLGTVYEDFLGFLENQKTAEVPIKDYRAFAYDWRMDVYDIIANGTKYENELRNVVTELENLASNSYTKKVTIIGHSNGGLLGKALITELERQGKAYLVEKFIMIGTPQLGTPKAIGTVLHGYDQQQLGGFLIDDNTSRRVINNMSGAYSLLPSEKYINEVDVPVVKFGTSTLTAPYRGAFGGAEISNFEQYKNFLLGNIGPERNLDVPISTPTKVNVGLLNKAFDNHRNKLDSWVAPSGIEVIEVVGTGLPTMKAVEYRAVDEGQSCTHINGVTNCVPIQKLKAYAQLSKYGDQTVMQRSAEAYGGNKDKFFLNLRILNELRLSEQNTPYSHYNLTEVPQLHTFISKIISSSSREGIDYLSRNYTEFNDTYDIEIIDSPVRITTKDETGKVTGLVIENGIETIKEEIPNSQYFEFGDTKYLVVPSVINRITTLYGEEAGRYTLTISQLENNDSQTIKHQLKNASVTPEMLVTYSKAGSQFSTVKTDYNGDGIIDTETTINGLAITYSYTDLRTAIIDASVPSTPEKVLLDLIRAAERASIQKIKYPIFKTVEELLLKQISLLVKLYVKKRYLTESEAQNIEKIIISLKK